MAIKIDLVADVKDVIKGTDKIGDALESLGDDLKDVGKEGAKIDDKVSDAFKNMGTAAKSAGDKIGKSVKDGTDEAGEGLDNMRSEAASTATESAASFASIEDAAGALQEVVANAFAGFGPAGMAAGLVAAAGIGLVVSSLTENAEKINENKEKMLGLAQTIKDNGGVLGEADYIRNMEEYGYAIQDTKEWFELFQDTAVSGFDKIRRLADDTSLSTQEIFKGGFGDGDEAEALLKRVQDELAGLREKKEAVYNTTGSILDPVDQRALTSLEETETLIRDNIQAQRDAYATERTRQQAIAGTTAELSEFITAQEKATDAVKGSITSQLDFMDKQEALAGQLTESNYAWDASTKAGRDNQRAVIDLANGIEDMAKAQIDAGDDVGVVTAKFEAQKDALINQVAPAFGGSKEAARQYIEQILKTPPAVSTKAQLTGVAEAEAQLRAFINQPRTIPMHISPNGQAVENYITGMTGRKIYVDIAPRGGVGITN